MPITRDRLGRFSGSGKAKHRTEGVGGKTIQERGKNRIVASNLMRSIRKPKSFSENDVVKVSRSVGGGYGRVLGRVKDYITVSRGKKSRIYHSSDLKKIK